MTRKSATAARKTRSRDERLEARVSRAQKRLLERAAELQGRTLNDFVIGSAQEAALRAIEGDRVIRLDARDSRAFAEALLDPPEPTEKLRAAARRYLENAKR